MTRTKSPTKSLQQVLDLLEGVRQGTKGYAALCPAHDDRRSSLSVAEGDDGRVLVHCFAGCKVADIVEALGLEMSDLFPRYRTQTFRKGVKRGFYA